MAKQSPDQKPAVNPHVTITLGMSALKELALQGASSRPMLLIEQARIRIRPLPIGG